MDDLARLMAERACEAAIHGFVAALDSYDYEAALRFWQPECRFLIPGHEYQGHAGLRSWMALREKDLICRHVMTNVVVTVHDATTARAHSLCSTWRVRGWRGREPGPINHPAFLVDFNDTLHKNEAGVWQLARREAFVALANVEQRQALRVS